MSVAPRVAHRGARSSQATCAAVDNSSESLTHKNPDTPGYFYYQARSDDMIISGGYNIAGPEIESALLQHEAVAECGVIGVPDELRGQIVKAFVVLRNPGQASDRLAAELQDYVKQTIAPYKYPRAIEFRESLPRTETGKLQRFRLRES